MKSYFTLFVLFVLRLFVFAQEGSLDETYAQQGSYIFRPDTQTVCYGGNIDADGIIMLCGWMEMPNSTGSVRYPMLARIDSNGNPDATFGEGGYIDASELAQLESFPYFGAAERLSSGKYVALAFDNFDNHQVFRFNADGTFDAGFAGALFQLHRAGFYRSAMDSQDRLIVSCFYFPDDNVYQYYGNVAVIRFTTDGALDTSFGNNGMVLLGNLENDERCYDVAVDGADNVYVSGYWSLTLGGGASSARVYGLDSNGQLRADFGSNGVFELSMPSVYNSFSGLCVANNGDVLVSGTRYTPLTFIQQGMVARLSSNGALVSSFGANGIHLSDDSDAEYKYITELTNDGTIAIAVKVNNGGNGRDARVSIINEYGVPINSFGTNGHSETFDIGTGDDTPYDIFSYSSRVFVTGYGDSYIENPDLGIQNGYKGFVACYAHAPLVEVRETVQSDPPVFPNPVRDILNVHGKEGTPYKLTDATGSVIESGLLHSRQLTVSNLPAGLYFLTIGKDVQKLVVE